MTWLTLFLAFLRSGSHQGRAKRAHRTALGRLSGGHRRTQRLAVEPLEDRLCLSIDLLVSSSYDGGVMRYNGTTGAFLGDFVPPGYGDLYHPHGLLIDADGNLLVVSVEDYRVARFDRMTGEFLGDFVPSGSGGVNRPVDVIFGLDGNLLVSSAETHSIKRYLATTGAYLGDFVPANSGGLHRPHGMVVGPDRSLYVMSADDDSVMRFDGATGAPLPAPGKSGAIFVDPGTLVNAWGELAFGPDGNLYVSNWGGSDVLRIDAATGNSLGEFVPAGDHGLTNSHGLVFGPDRNLYVVSQGSNSVLRYDGLTGAFINVFVPPVHLNGPTYLTFWDTGMQGPSGSGGGTGPAGMAGAAHGPGLADAAVLAGLAGTSNPPGDGNAPGKASAPSADRPVQSVDTLPFSGAGIIGGSLADGHYVLTIHGGLVHDGFGNALDGAGTGVAGSDRVDTFFRLFGDGDGVVDARDRALFRSAFQTRAGEAGSLWYFDYDGDGVVDGRDNGQFNRRFGHP
jgi:sugar lactone lactonase YvrE